MYKSYTMKSVLMFSILFCTRAAGTTVDINNSNLLILQLLYELYGINIMEFLLLNETDDTVNATLDAVKKNSSCIAQIMQTMETNQLDIDTKLDEFAVDNAQLFSTIESVDQRVIQTCKAVKLGDTMLKAKMDTVSGQVAELAENDALIFSAMESLDSDVDNVHTAITAGTIILGTQINDLSNQLTDTYVELSENDAKLFSAVDNVDTDLDKVQVAVIANNTMLKELSENDAKIFSTVEHIDTALGFIFCAASREREAEIVESPTAPHQVKFINNKLLNRTGGLTITEPGLYMLTESLIIDAGYGISIIQAYNVTLDLNGFTITANAEKAIPLSITQSDLVTIKNGTISGGQGIVMNGVYGTTLEKLTLTYSLNTGMHMSDVHGVTINQCVVRDSAQDGIVADTGSTELIMRDTTISDCQGIGLNLQGQGIVLKDVITQHNGGDGAHVANGSDVHFLRMVADNNNGNGINIDSSVTRVQVESCRVMGNGGIGYVDNGATLATWMNNLASGNVQDDYQNIKAVLASKATSFWHNVYGK